MYLNKNFVKISMLFFLVIAFSTIIFAQNFGCCCNPVTYSGNIEEEIACLAKNFTFTDLPDYGLTCDDKCGALFLIPRVPVCGDNICEGDETVSTCPSDCAAPVPKVMACGMPGYTPAPYGFSVAPIKGEKKFRLTFKQECPATYVQVLRYDPDLGYFKFIGKTTDNVYVDDDPDLEWDTNYTYNIFSFYVLAGDKSLEISAKANLGDVECWHSVLPLFCLNLNFYYQFEGYLKDNGYQGTSAASFDLNFERYVNETFRNKFNSAYSCNDYNQLVLKNSCSDQEACAIRSGLPVCIGVGPCDNNGPFGMFSSSDSCEFDPQTSQPRFCFFDNSETVVDACYDCLSGMACYDYKSKEACEKDNCGAGDCEWHTVIDDINIGVCVDTRMSNCEFCDISGSRNVENSDAFNDVFSVCDEKKAVALSVPDFACVFWKDYEEVLDCDDVACLHYSEQQCNSPPGGVKLAGDNSLVSWSNDPCQVGVCQFDTNNHECRKNAAGSLTDFDCPEDDFICESDHFPPITSVIPSGQLHVDFLNFIIMDKQRKLGLMKDFTGKPDFETFLCLKTGANSCADAKSFPLKINTDRLILKNLALKDGRTKIASLNKGSNNLFFYSSDPSNNVEVVKNITFDACDDCQGPTLLDVKITGGKPFGSVLYSSLYNPVITLVFDEPAKINSAALSGSPADVVFDPGYKFEHVLSFSESLTEGTFRLFLQAENDKHIKMPAPGLIFTLTIDTSLAQVSIIPADGSVLLSEDVDFDISFTKQADLTKVLLSHLSPINEYLLNETVFDITNNFTTTDNLRFFANLTDLEPGAYRLYVEAEDITSLPIAREVKFFIGSVDAFINLKFPRFGVSPTLSFYAEFETGLKYDECRYAFDLPAMPSVDLGSFANFPLASSNYGYSHKTNLLSVAYGDKGKHPLYVFCKKGTDIDVETFELVADPYPPVIVNAYAFPKIVAEEYIPGQNNYAALLKVETDKESFCKYSDKTDDFSLMESSFAGFGVTPKIAHSALVVVDEIKPYRYFVACESPAGVVSPPKALTFLVNLQQPFNVDVVTDPISKELEFDIGVQTNKLALCYFGESPFSITTPFGTGAVDYVHRQNISVQEEGSYDFFIKCTSPRSGENSGVVKATVVVDQTAPDMLWVKDNSTLKDPEVSYFTDKLRVAFLGNDSSSGISHYLVSVVESFTDGVVLNESVDRTLDGDYHYIDNLTLQDGKEYEAVVNAVDRAGLVSLPISSDGVFINSSAKPTTCSNDVKDNDETDVDCGGSCPPCNDGESCSVNSDCDSGLCLDDVCSAQDYSCDNGVKDGSETDVDCGGSCPPCSIGEDCYDDYDCESGYCSISTGECMDVPSCEDGVLSAGETDVDCGGPCMPCGEGQNCEVDSDCSIGLVCEGSVCIEELVEVLDSDKDSVSDVDDLCPNTPIGEPVDKYGCSVSQRMAKEEIVVEEEEGGFSFLLFFLIVLLLAGAGIGGYLLYQRLKEKGMFEPKVKVPEFPEVTRKIKRVKPGISKPHIKPVVAPKPKVKKLSPLEEKMKKLKEFAKKKGLGEDEWLELKPKSKKVSEDAVEKLRSRLRKLGSKDALERLKRKRSSGSEVFRNLKKSVEEHKRKKIKK